MRLQGQRDVQHLLDALLADFLDYFSNAPGMGCRLLDDVIAHLLLAAGRTLGYYAEKSAWPST
ncbi:MAG: hypothetical protein U5L11_15790 [Arhodomonas sp.]|nr:hypothetical protein [Arhodomonas sp.]